MDSLQPGQSTYAIKTKHEAQTFFGKEKAFKNVTEK